MPPSIAWAIFAGMINGAVMKNVENFLSFSHPKPLVPWQTRKLSVQLILATVTGGLYVLFAQTMEARFYFILFFLFYNCS